MIEHNPHSDDSNHFATTYAYSDVLDLQPDEELDSYCAEMKSSDNWLIPEPPVRDVGVCEIQSIQLKRLTLVGTTSDSAAELDVEYRASITFKLDNNKGPVTFKLYTNPVSVTPPPCRPGPKGAHEVHLRELPTYQKIWSLESLKDHKAEDCAEDEAMTINATSKGAEVFARAWCSERGKCAVIRRPDGPCFVCALRAAGKAGLWTGVLIWTG